jgi:predicted GNAT family N-acyltransferase
MDSRITVNLTTFAESGLAIRRVRDAVFGEEQRVPRDLDWDGRDPDCIQVVAAEGDGRPVGTGRLLPEGRIGRLAVLRPWRGQGIGARMLATLVAAARTRGDLQVHLHAQTHAVPFYKKHGFRVDGEVFVEAEIPHVNMTRRLDAPA